ncbi:uncharacterized protein BDV14DRAFT_193103 [Aspergillus stella-maris]|uniref:uncharacterized protein n=1 Tax=Aspergillus stella-maris TaxID=1810926 RepID=UPI003CCD6520
MDQLELAAFRAKGEESEETSGKWYTIAAVAVAAAGGGADVIEIYQMATAGLSVEEEKQVQRRFKEAILKTSILYGVPKSLKALLPLFGTLDEERIDHYGPRTEKMLNEEPLSIRRERARTYFDTLWTPAAAQANREKNFKYQPDLYLLNLETIYELWISETHILDAIETQCCNAVALICSGSPVQAMWHTRGIVRHGGTLEVARFAQDIGVAVATAYVIPIDKVVKVDDIAFDDTKPH